MANLVLEKFKFLSAREKLLSLVAVLSLSLFAIYFGLIVPLHNSYIAKIDSLAALRQNQSQLIILGQIEKENRIKIKRALGKRDSLKTRLALAEKNIIDSSRLNDILKLLSDPATGPDITLIGLSVKSESIIKEADDLGAGKANAQGSKPLVMASRLKYDRNQITIRVKSSFASLAYLFRKLIGGPMPLSISSLTIIRAPGARGLIAQIDLTVYTSPL